MKKLLVVFVAIALTGCATMVRIDTNVHGAKVTLDGERPMESPAVANLSDFVFSNYPVTIEAPGYQTVRASLKKEVKVGALVGSLFVGLPLLWVWGPAPNQYFELAPAN